MHRRVDLVKMAQRDTLNPSSYRCKSLLENTYKLYSTALTNRKKKRKQKMFKEKNNMDLLQAMPSQKQYVLWLMLKYIPKQKINHCCWLFNSFWFYYVWVHRKQPEVHGIPKTLHQSIHGTKNIWPLTKPNEMYVHNSQHDSTKYRLYCKIIGMKKVSKHQGVILN